MEAQNTNAWMQYIRKSAGELKAQHMALATELGQIPGKWPKTAFSGNQEMDAFSAFNAAVLDGITALSSLQYVEPTEALQQIIQRRFQEIVTTAMPAIDALQTQLAASPTQNFLPPQKAQTAQEILQNLRATMLGIHQAIDTHCGVSDTSSLALLGREQEAERRRALERAQEEKQQPHEEAPVAVPATIASASPPLPAAAPQSTLHTIQPHQPPVKRALPKEKTPKPAPAPAPKKISPQLKAIMDASTLTLRQHYQAIHGNIGYNCTATEWQNFSSQYGTTLTILSAFAGMEKNEYPSAALMPPIRDKLLEGLSSLDALRTYIRTSGAVNGVAALSELEILERETQQLSDLIAQNYRTTPQKSTIPGSYLA